jgi:hypothetical protein
MMYIPFGAKGIYIISGECHIIYPVTTCYSLLLQIFFSIKNVDNLYLEYGYKLSQIWKNKETMQCQRKKGKKSSDRTMGTSSCKSI